MIKKILKKVFPIALLKQAYLLYNQFRIKTVDKVLFPEYNLKPGDFVIQRDDYPFRLIKVKQDHLDHRLQKQFTHNENWTQDEYLLVFDKPCIIEPSQGWALTNLNKLIYPSLGFSRVPYLPKPSFVSLQKAKEGTFYEELISLRDTGEENYFHFYNDVLPKLFFLEEKLNLASSIPVLISEKLYASSYFQFFLKHPYLKSRNWIIQKNGFIRSNKTYFCKPLTHTKKYFDRVLELVPEIGSDSEMERRIFITRSPKRLRFLENGMEVEELCRRFGFEVLDFDTLTVEQQIKVFSQTKFAIGIHGAGLTNMIFRRGKPMSLLEIFPPGNYFPFHYVLLASQFGYEYDGIIGEKSKNNFSGGFLINAQELENKISLMLTLDGR